MTNTPIDKIAVAGHAAASVRQSVAYLQSLGLPLDAILSGILGEAVRTFAADQGWEEAACSRRWLATSGARAA